MSGPPTPGRRRVVTGLVAAAVVGVVGGTAALVRRDDELVTAATSTSTSASTSATGPTSPSTTGAPGSSAPETTTTTTAPSAATVVEVLCRNSWGAAPAGVGRPHTIDQITVHHSATRLDRNADVVQHLRGYQRDHQARGWADLAYHYVIDAEGHVFEARSTTIAGDTATGYDTAGHFLAMCDGNFEEQPLPDAQFEGLVRLLAWAVQHHGLGVDAISTHRDHAATACPGQALAARVDSGELARRVAALAGAGPLELRLVCADEGRSRVAAIESA